MPMGRLLYWEGFEGQACRQRCLASVLLTVDPNTIFSALRAQAEVLADRKALLVTSQRAMKLSVLTLKAPRRNSVGCSPTENISRRMVEAIKARMPWGLGRAMTMAREISMAVHSSPDQ